MITLEQIRLLESKITRAIELIHVLKDENSTLRKGLDSAQKRMKELEALVDGFKTDQGEIESVIIRTLHTLDEVEDSAAKKTDHPPGAQQVSAAPQPVAEAAPEPSASPVAAQPIGRHDLPTGGAAKPVSAADTATGVYASSKEAPPAKEPRAPKEELDIF